jgi:hypothetical protein
MSDDYAPTEISATDLLARWALAVRRVYSNGLVPIYWFVEGPGRGKLERMPFQYNHLKAAGAAPEDSNGADKGGFIQEATGWKPAILQAFVHLQTLVATRDGTPTL